MRFWVILFTMIILWNISFGWVIIEKNKEINKLNKELKESQEQFKEQTDELNLVYSELDDIINENQRLVSLESKPKELIKVIAEKQGIDPILAVAISRLETSNFTSDIYMQNNNVGGMRNGDGSWIYFNTLMEGVNAYILCLKEVYYDKGLTTPEQIQPKYCPSNDGGSNWLKQVKIIMKEEE